MEFTVSIFDHKLRVYQDNKFKKFIDLQGYTFRDKYGNCIMIVYGESRRDAIITILLNNIPFFVTYRYIDLK